MRCLAAWSLLLVWLYPGAGALGFHQQVPGVRGRSVLRRGGGRVVIWSSSGRDEAAGSSPGEKKKNRNNNEGMAGSGAVAGKDASEAESFRKTVGAWARANFFLLGMAAAVGCAAVAPRWGADGSWLRPETTIGSFGVAAVFLLSGLSLEFKELGAALLDVRFNALIQATSLVAWPLVVGYAVAVARRFADSKLLDGLLVTACLPTTVNMCVILTASAGGNVACALANAVIGNFLGVFVTPFSLLLAAGQSVALPVGAAISKLLVKVALPVCIGQLLRATPLLAFQTRHKPLFKKASEVCLLLIVWNAFCNSFLKGFGIMPLEFLALGATLVFAHLASLLGIRFLFQTLLSKPPRDALAGALVASHKTLAMGLPLITTIFHGSPDLAYFCAPIMLLHPTQLLVGSLLVPRWKRQLLLADDENHHGGDNLNVVNKKNR